MTGLIVKAAKPKNTIEARLRRVRVQIAGVNKEYFAKLLGVSFASYRLYEAGTRDLPLAAAIRVCEIYDLSADWFLLGKGEEE